MKIKAISAIEYLGTAWPLLEEHRQELATNPEKMRLDPDVATYAHLEELNRLMSLGVFTDDGEMVGYSINIVARNLHYDLVMCQNDILYLQKDHRVGATGLKLIRATEDHAKELGCDFMLWHAKPNTSLDKILPRVGYRVQDVMYSKELD
jgi:GNAT superfamily N-acetyltransferase